MKEEEREEEDDRGRERGEEERYEKKKRIGGRGGGGCVRCQDEGIFIQETWHYRLDPAHYTANLNRGEGGEMENMGS